MAAAEGVWVLGTGDRSGAQLSLMADSDVVRSVTVGIAPRAVVMGGDSIWVANGSGLGPVYGGGATGPGYPSEHSLARIKRTSGALLNEYPVEDPVDIGFGHGYVWIVAPGMVLRLDPASNEPPSTVISLPEMTSGRIDFTTNYVWVLADDRPILVRINPQDLMTTLVTVEQSGGLAGRRDEIWLFSDDGIMALNEETLTRTATFEGPFAYGLAANNLGVWVVDAENMAHLIDGAQPPANPCELVEPPIATSLVDDHAWFLGEHGLMSVELRP
ncbi:MAG TPA: hypothetical protein VE569_04535 [Acidimicrobiia bacterium]|nr:hypothetical protein [Acidimicrobiia bacterium]